MPLSSGAFNSTQSTIASSMPAEGMFAVIVIFIAVVLLTIIISSDAFARIARLLHAALSTIRYALYGIGTCGLLGAIYGLVMLFRAASGVINPILYVYAIVGYIGLTLIGKISEMVYLLLRKRYDEYRTTEMKDRKEILA